jgi:hypothetical protein
MLDRTGLDGTVPGLAEAEQTFFDQFRFRQRREGGVGSPHESDAHEVEQIGLIRQGINEHPAPPGSVREPPAYSHP